MENKYRDRLMTEFQVAFSDQSVYERSSIYEKVEKVFKKFETDIESDREYLSEIELRILDLFRDSKITFWSSDDVKKCIIKLLRGKWSWCYEYKDNILSFLGSVIFDFILAFFITLVFNFAFGDLYIMTWSKSLAFIILFDLFGARYKKLNV